MLTILIKDKNLCTNHKLLKLKFVVPNFWYQLDVNDVFYYLYEILNYY